jgi:hypothetical protein
MSFNSPIGCICKKIETCVFDTPSLKKINENVKISMALDFYH